MIATVEHRHRDAALRFMFGVGFRDFVFEAEEMERADALAQLLADTEAAEAEKSAALRAEFEACVRALRVGRGTHEDKCPNCCQDWPPGVECAGCRFTEMANVALDGPLAKEIPDA